MSSSLRDLPNSGERASPIQRSSPPPPPLSSSFRGMHEPTASRLLRDVIRAYWAGDVETAVIYVKAGATKQREHLEMLRSERNEDDIPTSPGIIE